MPDPCQRLDTGLIRYSQPSQRPVILAMPDGVHLVFAWAAHHGRVPDVDLDRVAAERVPDSIAELGSSVWAAGEAFRLLQKRRKKWAHTQQVARHARWASIGVPETERDRLVAAAFLHDIGYVRALSATGFHPLDGARYLRHLGLFDLACLVAHHSGAAVEAEHRGLADELAEFPRPAGPAADALTFADVTSGPTGKSVSPGDRFSEIVERHGPDSVVSESRAEARTQMYGAVGRTLRRASGARPPAEPLAVTTVELGCSTLVRFQGVLDETTAAHAERVLLDVLSGDTHRAICDLALVDIMDSAGAMSLAKAAIAGDAPLTLVDPAADQRSLIEAVVAQETVSIVTDLEAALAPHCG